METIAEDAFKDIIISSLQFLVKHGRIKLYRFVIMPDHIQLIWHIQDKYERAKIQQSFLIPNRFLDWSKRM